MYQTCTWLLTLSDDRTIACERYEREHDDPARGEDDEDHARARSVVDAPVVGVVAGVLLHASQLRVLSQDW